MTGRRRVIASCLLLAVGAAGAWLHWSWNLSPVIRARVVANVLAGRSPCDAGDPTAPPRNVVERFPALLATASGCQPADAATWASAELQRLAADHPAALARAAALERSPAARWALLDLVENHRSYVRHVPFAQRLEHASVHAVRRLDRPGGRPLSAAQQAALHEDPAEALRSLRNVLRQGHCGALAAYDLLGASPAGEDLHAAGAALAREAADPLSPFPPAVRESCLARIAERSAPSTDGAFGVLEKPSRAQD